MWRQIVRHYTTTGLRHAAHGFKDECTGVLRHLKGVRAARRYRDATGLRLNLGCGPNHKAGWINIDLVKDADVTLDLREPLPFRDGSCERIYTEHFLEHVDYPHDAHALLAECFRVLAPGGRISIGVPDTQWPLLEYAQVRDEGYFQQAKSRWHPDWCETRMEHINFHFRQGGEHRFAYDFDTLAHALGRAGFTEVSRRGFDPAVDSPSRAVGTLYVDGRKT